MSPFRVDYTALSSVVRVIRTMLSAYLEARGMV